MEDKFGPVFFLPRYNCFKSRKDLAIPASMSFAYELGMK